MTEQINSGGPAFPHDDLAQYNERAGMTLRDYFAAQAMQALIASKPGKKWATQIAQQAYIAADAMLSVREGGAE